MSIYQELILDHYNNPRNHGTLPNPSGKVDVFNPLCGDKLHMEVLDKDGKVESIAFSGEGCAISQASASMLTEYAKGKTKQELMDLKKEAIIEMIGVELSPNRLKCALLSWEALIKILQLPHDR
jgi:nitrogen fixation protein NifU and related proteins